MGRKKQYLTEKMCSKCKIIKLIELFAKKRKDGDAYTAICKKCNTDAVRAYTKVTNYAHKRYWENRDAERERHLIKKYGIDFPEYHLMLKRQNGLCLICQVPEPKHKMFDVDHDHKTGIVRGLLCTSCNRMLGHAKDSEFILRRAADYLICTTNSL